MKILTNEELARAEAVNRNVLTTSDRYKFISTMDMIQTVRCVNPPTAGKTAGSAVC